MKLIITRHGQTEENKAGIMQGHLPGKLSELGIEQAKKVAKRLKGEHIDHIYSSDLARSADTAKEIAKFHPDTPLEFTKELREIYLGEFQGKTRTEIKMKRNIFDVKSKDGETFKELHERTDKFIHKILKKHPKDTVLIVGHGGINVAITAVITKQSHDKMVEMERLKNTSINIFEIDEEKNHKIHLYNCAKHLD